MAGIDRDPGAVLAPEGQLARRDRHSGDGHLRDRVADSVAHFRRDDEVEQVAPDGLFRRVAVERFGRPVPILGGAVWAVTLDGDELHALQDGAEPLLAQPQVLVGPAVFGDVVDHAKHGTAGRVVFRDHMNHDGLAVGRTPDLELRVVRPAGLNQVADGLVQLVPGLGQAEGLELGEHEVPVCNPADLPGARGDGHRLRDEIDLQVPEAGHLLGAPQARLAMREGQLGLFEHRDVLDQAVIGHQDIVLVAMGDKRVPDPALGADAVDNAVFDGRRHLAGENPPGLFEHRGPVLRHHHAEPQGGVIGEILRFVPGDCEAARAVSGRHRASALDPHRKDVVGNRPDDPRVAILAVLQGLLDVPELLMVGPFAPGALDGMGQRGVVRRRLDHAIQDAGRELMTVRAVRHQQEDREGVVVFGHPAGRAPVRQLRLDQRHRWNARRRRSAGGGEGGGHNDLVRVGVARERLLDRRDRILRVAHQKDSFPRNHGRGIGRGRCRAKVILRISRRPDCAFLAVLPVPVGGGPRPPGIWLCLGRRRGGIYRSG